jgi:hypothetical protein
MKCFTYKLTNLLVDPIIELYRILVVLNSVDLVLFEFNNAWELGTVAFLSPTLFLSFGKRRFDLSFSNLNSLTFIFIGVSP